MQSAAGPPGGSNPKRTTGRSHRSADGASPAALDRSPREVARPAHAHGLASTATFGGSICAFIALWILLAPGHLKPDPLTPNALAPDSLAPDLILQPWPLTPDS